MEPLRGRAAALYQSGLYKDAIDIYDEVICETRKNVDFTEDQKNELLSITYSNKAQVYLKLRDYRLAKEAATSALLKDNKNTKALYRKTCASEELGEISDAIESVKAWLAIEPKNAVALHKQLHLKNKSREEEAPCSKGVRGRLLHEEIPVQLPNIHEIAGEIQLL
eukprot:Filipodium_phascolosomae@DN1235_c0_g1_i2.p1